MAKNEFLRGKPRDAADGQILSLAIKIVTIVVIFAGVWASTQRFASLVGHDPGWVGEPFHTLNLRDSVIPLYRPWLILLWTLENLRRVDVHPLLHWTLPHLLDTKKSM